MASASDVKKLREKLGCGMMIAARALDMRDGDMELAEEYVIRCSLAVRMSDERRFPKYYAKMKLAKK